MKNELRQKLNRFEKIMDEPEGGSVTALSDDDLSMVSAAGELTFAQTNPAIRSDIAPIFQGTPFGNISSGESGNCGNTDYGGKAEYRPQSGTETCGSIMKESKSNSPISGPIVHDALPL